MVNVVAKTSASSSAVANINDADNAIVSASASLEHKTKVRDNGKDKSSDNKRTKASAEAKAQLDAAQNLLGQAQAKFKSGNYNDAVQLGDKALQNVRKAQGIINIEDKPQDNKQPVDVDVNEIVLRPVGQGF